MKKEVIEKIEELGKKQIELSSLVSKEYLKDSQSGLEKVIKELCSYYTPEFSNSIISINEKPKFEYLSKIIEDYNKSLKAMNKTIQINKRFNFINTYINNIEKIYTINIKKNPTINNLEYLTIVNKIVNNTIKNINMFIDNEDSTYELKELKGLRQIENAIPQYIGYAYRDESKDSINEAYEKSILNELEEEGNAIIQLIKAINEKDSTFFCDKNALMDLAANINRIVQKENDFIIIINCIYKAIYEGSDTNNNKIFKLAQKNSDPCLQHMLDFTKHIRQFFLHSNEKTNKKYISETRNFIKKIINKEVATKSKDWTCLQLGFYREISTMLEKVFEYL